MNRLPPDPGPTPLPHVIIGNGHDQLLSLSALVREALLTPSNGLTIEQFDAMTDDIEGANAFAVQGVEAANTFSLILNHVHAFVRLLESKPMALTVTNLMLKTSVGAVHDFLHLLAVFQDNAHTPDRPNHFPMIPMIHGIKLPELLEDCAKLLKLYEGHLTTSSSETN